MLRWMHIKSRNRWYCYKNNKKVATVSYIDFIPKSDKHKPSSTYIIHIPGIANDIRFSRTLEMAKKIVEKELIC